jgi:hypothetical protein
MSGKRRRNLNLGFDRPRSAFSPFSKERRDFTADRRTPFAEACAVRCDYEFKSGSCAALIKLEFVW